MMYRFLLTTGMLASGFVLPLTAHAYLSPEDVLQEEDFSTRFLMTPPPNARHADSVVEEQRQASAERRETELNAVKPQAEEEHAAAPEEQTGEDDEIERLIEALRQLGEDQESMHGAAPEAPQEGSGLSGTEERLLERIRMQQQEAEQEARYQAWLASRGLAENDESLHSGAPLSETGPATVITFFVVAGAIAETWRRVRHMERM